MLVNNSLSTTDVKDILLDRTDIIDICCLEDSEYYCNHFEILIQCKLCIGIRYIPILIGIPKNWETQLFSIYLIGYGYANNKSSSFKKLGYDDCACFKTYIPHVDPYNGKICIVDLDTILIDAQFEGLFNQCIDIAKSVIEKGIKQENTNDFIKEFTSYWEGFQDCIQADFLRPKDNESTLLKYSHYGESNKLILADKQERLQFWNSTTQICNAAYFKINAGDDILPPDPRYKLPNSFLDILLSKISVKKIKKQYYKLKNPSILLFEISFSDATSVYIGIQIIVGKLIINNASFICSNEVVLRPVSINLIDKNFLIKRLQPFSNHIKDKNFLIIGCGSIGGYVASMLVKSGVEKITLMDFDKLKPINIYRHILGAKYVDRSKVFALSEYLTYNYPDLSITPIEAKLEDSVLKKSITLSDFDYIFSVTGNQNLNLWLETYICDNKLNVKVIYGWNEPLDIGCHSVFVDYSKNGRLKKLFIRLENGTLFDSSSYTAPNQKISIDNNGCGGSYIQYNSDVSIKTSLHCINMFKQSEDSLIDSNYILSEKGSGIYFSKAGLTHSTNYEQQSEIIKTTQL